MRIKQQVRTSAKRRTIIKEGLTANSEGGRAQSPELETMSTAAREVEDMCNVDFVRCQEALLPSIVLLASAVLTQVQ